MNIAVIRLRDGTVNTEFLLTYEVPTHGAFQAALFAFWGEAAKERAADAPGSYKSFLDYRDQLAAFLDSRFTPVNYVEYGVPYVGGVFLEANRRTQDAETAKGA